MPFVLLSVGVSNGARGGGKVQGESLFEIPPICVCYF